ncbi:MAG: hypothetical protein QM753_16785 [Thermomicrobiales bacterium]
MRFYRLVEHNPPDSWDMQSMEERGIPIRRDTPENRHNARGLSVFDTWEHAEMQARRLIAGRINNGPPLAYLAIATIELPDTDTRFTMRRTGAAAGHYTLDASSEARHAILGYVTQCDEVYRAPWS